MRRSKSTSAHVFIDPGFIFIFYSLDSGLFSFCETVEFNQFNTLHFYQSLPMILSWALVVNMVSWHQKLYRIQQVVVNQTCRGSLKLIWYTIW